MEYLARGDFKKLIEDHFRSEPLRSRKTPRPATLATPTVPPPQPPPQPGSDPGSQFVIIHSQQGPASGPPAAQPAPAACPMAGSRKEPTDLPTPARRQAGDWPRQVA